MALSTRAFKNIARSALRNRAFSYTRSRSQDTVPINSRANDTAKKHREYMLRKPLNPHLTNTNSTIANEFPSVGADKPPADMLTSVDSQFVPIDSVPENTERMVGGTQKSKPESGANAELDVGEIEGNKVKIAPLKRQDETEDTLRARLTYQSRKRGTLESDLLLSTFADAQLGSMTYAQMQSYDSFLDENDWDIYYWATQTPTITSHETAEGGIPTLATAAAAGSSPTSPSFPLTASTSNGVDQIEKTRAAQSEISAQEATAKASNPSSGEWAYTVGTFKPAYRPVPIRWKNSEILSMLRNHVISRSAGGVHEGEDARVDGEGLARSVEGTGGGGLGMMPPLKHFRNPEYSA